MSAPLPRRRFLALSGAMVPALSALAAGCATVAAVPAPVQGGRLTLLLRNHPGLQGPGGFLKVLPEGASQPIYVLSRDGEWSALSPICTHLGCTVEVEGASLVCPCHGSTYDRSGRVLRGPAERSLAGYPVREEPEGTLVIDLSGRTGG